MDNSMCHNGSKIEPTFPRHHLFRVSHPPYSPDRGPGSFWLFGRLNGSLNDREFISTDEIEEAMTNVWPHVTFHDMQSVFRTWVSRLSWVKENRRLHIHE
jgi:hypothetical protein